MTRTVWMIAFFVQTLLSFYLLLQTDRARREVRAADIALREAQTAMDHLETADDNLKKEHTEAMTVMRQAGIEIDRLRALCEERKK